jgi:RimJ/RimL family protein N-acetyltransferase
VRLANQTGLMIDFEQKPEYREWLGEQLGYNYEDGYTTLANLDSKGEILCVVLYSRWMENGCEMVIASSSPRWATRAFISAAFTYPFIQMKKRRVTFIVSETNVKSLKMCLRLGATVEGKLRKWFGDNDGVVFGMLKEDCKYIRETARSHSQSRRYG